MKLIIFVLILACSGHLNLQAQPNGRKILNDFLDDVSLTGAQTGIFVADVSTGKLLLSENGQQLLAPASVLKLVTTASALEILGPDYHFRTVAGYTGTVDTPYKMLMGNLIIRGGGDPTTGSVWFSDTAHPQEICNPWIEKLKLSGIGRVEGDLIVDISAYGNITPPGGWAWEDIGNYYGAAPSGLSVFDNMVRLYFDSPVKPGEPVHFLGSDPVTPDITWQNELLSSAVNRDQAYVFASPWDVKRLITGTIPAGKKNFEVKASMPDPPLFFGNYLKMKLEEAGIPVEGRVRVSCYPWPCQPLDTMISPPLHEIIRIINHESVNLFAEHLILQIEYEQSGKGSLPGGLETIREFWRQRGISDPWFLEDGSGLSRSNAISAKQLSEILLIMHNGKHRELFKSSLPNAGEGTLASFRIRDFPGQILRCKSGSMERVRGYAGYLLCDSGREVAFAILCNNFPGSQQEVTANIQRLLLKMKGEL